MRNEHTLLAALDALLAALAGSGSLLLRHGGCDRQLVFSVDGAWCYIRPKGPEWSRGRELIKQQGDTKSDDREVRPVNGTRATSNQATVARDRKRRAVCTRSEARAQIVRLSLETPPKLE